MAELLLIFLIGGTLGGFAGRVMRAGGLGIVGNIFLGMLGAWAGSELPKWLGLGQRVQELNLLTALAGASLLLLVVGLFIRN